MPVPDTARASALLPVVFVICSVLAAANLCGWLLGIRQLVSIAPGLPAMVPVTSLLALLTGGGLWAQWRWPQRSAVTAAGPTAVIALGLAIEACYLAGAAPAPFLLVQAGQESGYNLSSPVTAAMFVALGLASLLLARAAKVRTAQGIALGVFLLALLNLTGYLFRDTSLFALLPGRGTSILTSLQLLLLAAGVLVLRLGSGLMTAMTGRSPSARIARRLLVSAFLVPVATGAALFASARGGLFDEPSVLPLFAWLVVVLLLTIIWRFALQLRTVDLARAAARAELQAALEALRAEHDRKDIFLATLAHELRNPLAPVSAAAEVLRLGAAESVEDRRRLGTVIGTQVGHIVDLVNDLLDVERITRGRLALDRQVLDIREPIAGAFEQVRPLMARKQHACHLHQPPHPVHVCGEGRRLVQILANLLNNAAKYTAPGGVIDVRVTVLAARVEIAVEDNGVGIPAALLPHVFDTYTQAAPTPDRAEGGLGLGLALVKELAALHNGSVHAASAGPGRGSTFTLTLPLAGAGVAARTSTA